MLGTELINDVDDTAAASGEFDGFGILVCAIAIIAANPRADAAAAHMYPELELAAFGLAIDNVATGGTEYDFNNVETEDSGAVRVATGVCAKVCDVCWFAWKRIRQTKAIAKKVRAAVHWCKHHTPCGWRVMPGGAALFLDIA
eukprot:CAMPEP_0172844902 /NCGR_PEP_ID=MMETSP1075-20121228/32566_1 /TAXON_ID=2916 /ORGANISM="Ceratium fusus, Strain PA161109" /LENGTH=142 /DNA_ID=CAMNT_0013689441 /DNA_START=466 /DNA_END=891 /DNA_ORIENTATION=+